MKNKNFFMNILNIILPAALFYLFYKLIGLIFAVVISTVYATVMMLIEYKHSKRISNTRVIGIIGLILSAISSFFTGYKNLYYAPQLVSNIVIFVFMIILTAKKRSVLHYIMKDFGVQWLENIDEHSALKLNYI